MRATALRNAVSRGTKSAGPPNGPAFFYFFALGMRLSGGWRACYYFIVNDKLFATGMIGTLVTALCCFTPVLVWGLSGLGLAALTGYLDLVLLPVLFGFAAITVYALWWKTSRKTRRT